MSEEQKQNIIRKGYWWLYRKPSIDKSGREHVAEAVVNIVAGGLMGGGITNFFIYANPLYLLIAIPGLFHLGMISRNMHKWNVEHRKRNEEFRKTHDGMDMLTWAMAHKGELIAEAEALRRMVQDNMDELVRMGLVKEEFDKDGKQAWYIPEDKVADVEKFLKELDENEKKEEKEDGAG
jgi:hypothetical protein